ncbi:hypothetical protein MPTK1_7g18410 [Marchantia polymorpha subsp. ruderalis]|nr:hypothetical protein MARPO_0165s0001 [Marchantia polymorpha]BBN17971.1 hypothetical protein Mp_7g18410 [Marchantia polymorpha subsp. ruderalis]|eukprot:PTQ28371.1 hypothetical protein MARPO_0165s0001 [Marchantia polymorpha]
MMKIATRSLVLMTAIAGTVAMFSSAAIAADVYECDYKNECGVDVHVTVSPSYKSKYGYKGDDEFDLHDKASKLVRYTLEKLSSPLDLLGIFWNLKAVVDGEELDASCFVPLNAKVVITKRNGRVCSEVYVYSKILRKYFVISVVYLH